MSEDPILAALARLEFKFESSIARVEAEQTRMREEQTRMREEQTQMREEQTRMREEQTRIREQFGNKLDEILDKLRAVREDTENTQAHVLYGLQQNLTLGQRITKLEDQMRRAGH